MGASSIGIQVIMPKTGTSPKETPPSPANERDRETAVAAADAATKQAPPPPGMGKLLDKTV